MTTTATEFATPAQGHPPAPDCFNSEDPPANPPVWDYGDAPDSTNGIMSTDYQVFFNGPRPAPPGQFPTLSGTVFSRYATPGARHQIVDIAWLGDDALYPYPPAPNPSPLAPGDFPPSRERDADTFPDPDPTTNFDGAASDWDVGDNGLRPAILTPNSASVEYRVSSRTGIQGWYINMLIDWNYDGQWVGLDEWVIRDRQVSVPPSSSTLFTDFVGLGPLLYEPWVRITLSDTPVSTGGLVPVDWPDGWDGSTPPGTLDFNGNPAFACGETEDYCGQVQIQYVNPLQPRVLCRHDHA